MPKVGYIAKVRSKGTDYFYLRKSVRKGDLVEKKKIFSFGSRTNALENLKYWYLHMEDFPKELSKLGYEKEDISCWINDIESK